MSFIFTVLKSMTRRPTLSKTVLHKDWRLCFRMELKQILIFFEKFDRIYLWLIVSYGGNLPNLINKHSSLKYFWVKKKTTGLVKVSAS